MLLLPDGDRLVVHDSVPPTWQAGQRVVVLVHGLGGCYQSGSMRRAAVSLFRRGIRVVRVNLRGAGPGLGLSRLLYNAGCSPDIRHVIEEVGRWAPGSPCFVVGFSLGGNIVMKLAGEATVHPLPNLAGVAAVSAPLDMIRCCAMLAQPSNRLYDRYYVRRLVAQVERLQSLVPEVPRTTFPRQLTLRQFDEIHTAPRWGFADALDYYGKAQALPWVPRIEVPSLLITARDDPFIDAESYEALPKSPRQQVVITQRGGHLGFLGPDGAGGSRWAERRVEDWVSNLPVPNRKVTVDRAVVSA